MATMRLKYILVFILAGLAAVLGLAYVVSRGFSARDEPTAAEALLARQLRHMAVPRAAREMTNPVPNDPAVVAEAMEHFADHCATCHANDGSGNTAIGKGLYPKPPDMRQADTQNLSDGELYYIVHNGVRFTGMPAFGEEIGNEQDKESWDLVHFIRHLPDLTDDEAAKMKKMNPKSPMETAQEERMRKFLQGDDSQPAEVSHEHHQ